MSKSTRGNALAPENKSLENSAESKESTEAINAAVESKESVPGGPVGIKVRFAHHHGDYVPGDVDHVDPMYASALIEGGVAAKVEQE